MARCGGKWPSLFRDNVSHPMPDGGISQLGLPMSPTGLHFPCRLRSERPKPTKVTPLPFRKLTLGEGYTAQRPRHCLWPGLELLPDLTSIQVCLKTRWCWGWLAYPLSITFSRKGWPGMVVGGDVVGNGRWVFLTRSQCIVRGSGSLPPTRETCTRPPPQSLLEVFAFVRVDSYGIVT